MQLFESIEKGASEQLEIILKKGRDKYNELYLENKTYAFDFFNKMYNSNIESKFKSIYLQIILKWPLIFMSNYNYHQSNIFTILNYSDFVMGLYKINGGIKNLLDLVYKKVKN